MCSDCINQTEGRTRIGEEGTLLQEEDWKVATEIKRYQTVAAPGMTTPSMTAPGMTAPGVTRSGIDWLGSTPVPVALANFNPPGVA